MGKIKVRTLGDEKQEKKEKKQAQLRAASKKRPHEVDSPLVGQVLSEGTEEKKLKKENPAVDGKKAPEEKTNKPDTTAKTAQPVQVKKEKSEGTPQKSAKITKKQKRSKNYDNAAKMIDKNKKYSLKDALEILPKLKIAKFDETVELHINTIEKNIAGNVSLPHGTGKQIKIEIVSQAENPKQVDEIIKKVEAGKIDFDVLIATPDTMPRLARIARFLGPRGLMPNPKNGTITPKPNEVAKKFQGGQINFKTEAKFPILHMTVGKTSFGEKKLTDNIKAAVTAIQTKNIKNITLKSTMSPAIKLDTTSIN